MKKTLSLLITLAILITSVGVAFAASDELSEMGNSIRWKEGMIVAVGTGAPPSYAASQSQAYALARRAAIVDGYRNLAELVYGVQVDANTTVEQLVVKNDTIQTAVSGLIQNARILKEKQLSNGGYQVLIGINIYGAPTSLAATIWQDKPPAIAAPAPTQPVVITPITPPNNTLQAPATTPTAPQTNSLTVPGATTGIIIDARGLGLERVMAPNIVDETGRVVYGSQYVDGDYIVRYGLVDYSDGSSDLGRAGAAPLTIKAIGVRDFNRNVIISKDDADRILAANQKGNFLKNCSVVFLQ